MRVFKTLAFIILVLCAGLANAALFDGNAWTQSDRVGKLYMSRGLLDGAAFGFLAASRKDDVNNSCSSLAMRNYEAHYKTIKNVSIDQLSSGLDSFYENYANRSIPTYLALEIVLETISGSSPEYLDFKTRKFRELGME